jgi:hypothetical protein
MRDGKAQRKRKKHEALNARTGRNRFPRDPRNPFRPGAYAACFDILAAHAAGGGVMRRELVRLLAKEVGDPVRAEYDVRIVETATPNQAGWNNNCSRRHRSCRCGFYIVRTGDRLKLMVDPERDAAGRRATSGESLSSAGDAD